MHALNDFLSTDYGLLSLVVIVGVLIIAGFYWRFFARHIAEDVKRHDAELAAQRTAH